MAKRSRNVRIEPRFEETRGPRGAVELTASEDDRVVKPARRAASGGSKASAQGKGARGASARASRSRGRGKGSRGGFSVLGLLRGGVYWALVASIWIGIAGAAMVAWYGARMPSATTWSVPDRPPNVRIVAADGQLLANRGMTGGEAIGLHEMSPHIPQAVIAIEDRRFYSHFGVDPIGLARAMAANLVEGRLVQGGSTLTQQLAKNLFLNADRTVERKVQEVLLSLWLEQKHTKAQILEMYLNRVYFGSGAYGVEAASRRYFGKSARDVTLSEAALLAGLLKAPSRLSPARDPKAAEARAQLVLSAMAEQGMIGGSEMTAAISAPATRAAAYWTGSEHYVADRVMEELPGLIGDVRTDVVVETTIDLTLQKLAETSIRKLIAENREKFAVTQGALVSIDNSGAVRAMVGGADYANSQFDRASEARRQPGSAFKPFVFLAALEQGRTPESIRNDAPVKIGKWTPENYNGKYYGEVTLTAALSKSLNSVAAQLAMEAGPKAVVEVAHRLGIESSLVANTSIALGTSEVTPLELTAAYVPFANGGYRPQTHFVQRVKSAASGKVLYEHPQGGIPRVINPQFVAMMNAMMAETIRTGTARKADFGWPAAGKTGTSQNARDAWFVGYTANLTTGVWFGNDDATPMKGVTGGSLPAIAWKDFMTAAHEGVPVVALPGAGWRRYLPADEPVRRPALPVGSPEDDAPAISSAPAPRRDETTASIRRPSAGVGEDSGPRGSIMDIILGR
ncbi:transglycosylase domain-containing protein [Aquibium sp. ELW1220]|uniref:transglycosylase domain-containing protein n=1 Tax=Aquibium sp. ELW1220 TaxID=2976766 RepID=UPI0025AFA1D8|nr:transglycosylase domain-containing protein [Aquibium sp. ELW1220]MDN2581933.1 penicillin-binding protein [Aquibium sp. ELW1220]